MVKKPPAIAERAVPPAAVPKPSPLTRHPCSLVGISRSFEPGDSELARFNQRGGLVNAHALFGNGLNHLLKELNARIVA